MKSPKFLLKSFKYSYSIIKDEINFTNLFKTVHIR